MSSAPAQPAADLHWTSCIQRKARGGSVNAMTNPLASLLPGLDRVWQHTRGDARVVIAVLDGPVDASHPCFRGARLEGCDGQRNGLVGALGRGLATAHGTHVASTLVGQPGTSVVGLAPGCTVRMCPVFADDGAGGVRTCTQPELARAIWSALRPRRGLPLPMIINISGGELMPKCRGAHCPTANGFSHPSLRAAVEECRRRGVLVVAAAGNDGCRCHHVPAALPWVLAVGSLEQEGPAAYSNWGPAYLRQGVLAPGRGIHGAQPGGGAVARDGTSFACAVVSGISGLLLSLQLARGASADTAAVRAAILASRRPVGRLRTSFLSQNHPGALDLRRAVEQLSSPKGVLHMSSTANDLVGDTGGLRPSAVDPSCGCGSPTNVVEDRAFDDEAQGVAPAAAARPLASRRTRSNDRLVGPSDCGCQGGKQLVYAIGQLSYDFGTLVRQRSLQDSFDGAVLNDLHVSVPKHFLMYLLGYRGAGPDDKPHQYGGHLHDAASVTWLLMQDDCPRFALRPAPPFSEAGYLELIRFFLDSLELTGPDPVVDGDLSITTRCLGRYDECHRGLGQGEESDTAGESTAATAADKQLTESAVQAVEMTFGEDALLKTLMAFSGRLSGTAQLLSGETVDVIEFDMRGTSHWDSRSLLDSLPDAVLSRDEALALVSRLINRLYQEIRNDRRSPEERSLNYGSTAAVRLLGGFLRDPNGPFARFVADSIKNVAVDSVDVQPSRCRRVDSDPYDVEISFFDFENVQRGQTVLSLTIDVADVVPHLDSYRLFTRR
jgi:cyanobactin maturation PatA/PatG family protease